MSCTPTGVYFSRLNISILPAWPRSITARHKAWYVFIPLPASKDERRYGYTWEGVDRWMLQVLLVEVLNMRIVCRVLAAALVANGRKWGNSVGVWTIKRTTYSIYILLRYSNIKRNKGVVWGLVNSLNWRLSCKKQVLSNFSTCGKGLQYKVTSFF